MQVIGESFYYNISGIIFCRDIGELAYIVDEIASGIMICDIDMLGFVVVDGILRKVNTRLIVSV